MKKTAAAICGAASACAFHVAHAQSSVTLYGIIDNGIEYRTAASGTVVRAVSGGLFASRYGLKGSEDIGGGLRINFQLEQGFSGVTGAAANSAEAFNRQAWVGISGSFGEARFGLQNTPQYVFMNPELDPVAVQSLGSPMNSFNSLTIRVNNAISYFTPTLYGLSGQFMVAMRDSTTKPANGFQFYNAALRYVNGPLRLAAGYEQAANAAGTSILKIFNAGASVGVGAARLYLAYHNERQTDNSVKRDVYEVSGSYSFTPADQLSLMYGYAHDRLGQGNNAQQIGLTYSYSLSKRTTLYGSAGFLQNRNQARFTLNGTGYTGLAVTPGANTRGVILGMLHRF
ncbi:porin [Trinickia caryophylli]|uniref:Outer membrane protein (Porin) n=1 Tax=Trinickia caryophylli TaxID=28094 RepID=A0A1X7E9T7_TRICW|nr:porin [Trinickia caryophylli]PMS13002.1 porin [Trinickia caryophylli]TRX14763.1 porin [Trinickia caryophylli]WQE14610.1 porin [Trinickia caryophylli]SMF30025.1 Outer membrane protein (porin) [Trinickia caryophylli]GLU31975.1 porin [Trinickia caryophylli]